MRGFSSTVTIARRQNVAGFAQAAVSDRANAARAARHEAADRGRALGRGMHAQLPAVRPGRGIEIRHIDARLAAHDAGLMPFDARSESSGRAARRLRAAPPARNCRCRAARRERDAEACAGGRNRDHVGFVARRRQRHRRSCREAARSASGCTRRNRASAAAPADVGRDRHIAERVEESAEHRMRLDECRTWTMLPVEGL